MRKKTVFLNLIRRFFYISLNNLKFSMGFKSELWYLQGKTIIFSFLSHSFIDLNVWLGAIFRWNFHSESGLKGIRLWNNIHWKLSEFIFPSILRRLHFPSYENVLHSITEPLPICLLKNLWDFCLKTYQ